MHSARKRPSRPLNHLLDHEYLAMLPLPFWTGGNGIAGPSARHPDLIRVTHGEAFPPNSPIYNPGLMLEGASAKAFAWALQALLDGAVQLSPDAQLVVPTLGKGGPLWPAPRDG